MSRLHDLKSARGGTYPQGVDNDPLAMLIDRFFWLERENARLSRELTGLADRGLCGPPPPPPYWLAKLRAGDRA